MPRSGGASVRAEVCDADGCSEVRRGLPIDLGPATAAKILLDAGDIGDGLDVGDVRVTVELLDGAGEQLARTEQVVTLEAVYPNGRECDGRVRRRHGRPRRW